MHFHGPAQDDQVAPLAMMDCTQDHDWWILISMSWLNARINHPLNLSPAYPSHTTTVFYEESGLIIEDAVFPVTRVSASVVLAQLTAMSPMHQSSLGHLVGCCDRYPGGKIRFLTVRAVMFLPKWRIICILRWEEMKRFTLAIWSKWLSSWGVDIFLWSGRPCCLLSRRILSTHPCDTPIIIAISQWEWPCVGNKSTCYNTSMG